MKKILMVIGTRPEAIKMAPLVHAFRNHSEINLKLCLTAQHREMLDQVLKLFHIKTDVDLDLMEPGQSLSRLSSKILSSLEKVLKKESFDWVFVHGDTSTTLMSSLCSFYHHVPVAHVEAGLRTHDLSAPFPEEANRLLCSHLSRLHFAPTEQAKENLLKEGIDAKKIHVTGNTVIDALFLALKMIDEDEALKLSMERQFSFLKGGKPLLLVTGHRRENFGQGFLNICEAIKEITLKNDIEIIYPVHLNPQVQDPVKSILSGLGNVHLVEPLDYFPFVYLMSKSDIILTDSGGIQEEAPSLGKPVLVMREVTERPEAVDLGTVLLVGTDKEKIIQETERLLNDKSHYARMSQAKNPYGDGKAVMRIMEVLLNES